MSYLVIERNAMEDTIINVLCKVSNTNLANAYMKICTCESTNYLCVEECDPMGTYAYDPLDDDIILELI